MFFQVSDKKRIYTFPFVFFLRYPIEGWCAVFFFTEVFGLWTSEWAISRLQDRDKVPATHQGEPSQHCCHCCTTYFWYYDFSITSDLTNIKQKTPLTNRRNTSRHVIQSNLPHLSHLPRSRMCPRDGDIVDLEHGAYHDCFVMAVMWLD